MYVRGADLAVRDGVEHLADLGRIIDLLFSAGQWVGGRQGVHSEHLL